MTQSLMRLNRRACSIHLGKGWLAGPSASGTSQFFEDGDFVDFNHLDPSLVGVVDVGAVDAGVVAHVQRLVAVASESKPSLSKALPSGFMPRMSNPRCTMPVSAQMRSSNRKRPFLSMA